MSTLNLPTEIQIMILKMVVHGSNASSATLAEADFAKYPAENYYLAAAFVAGGPTSPRRPTRKGSLRRRKAMIPRKEPIQNIDDLLLLRTALAVALPTWRAALCAIPTLWTRIAVAVDASTYRRRALDAVSEALVCSLGEPLSVLLTRRPREQQNTVNEDSKNGERARVTRVMALLVPHIARWRYLRVCTLHAGALPVPRMDFSGDAPILEELHLCAERPPRHGARLAPVHTTTVFETPLLQDLTMDAHVFRAAYLHAPSTLPAADVCTLTVCGPAKQEGLKTRAAMSVRELLACVAQMRSLDTLRLDGLHLNVGSPRKREGDEEVEVAAQASTRPVLQQVLRMHCARLRAAVLAKVLALARSEDSGPDTLEIVQCALPSAPRSIENYTCIDVVNIDPCEDVGSFLQHATQCLVLAVVNCDEFLPDALQEPIWGEGGQQWLLPRLEVLRVAVDPDLMHPKFTRWMRDVARRRREASRNLEDVDELSEVTVNGKRIRA